MPEKLGQNFLINKEIIKKIIAFSSLESATVVLEVGPGRGILTEELLKLAKKVIAVEIDGKLVSDLRKKFKEKKNISLIEGDILKINLEDLLLKNNQSGKLESYKLVSNIPYYITSKIIRFFLENSNPPQKMILMIQKEVAERIVAKPGKMSLLSTSVQYYAKAEILFSVPKNCFSPIPKVDSAVIQIIPEIKPELKEFSLNFFRIAKIGFSGKRKTLLNNLFNGLHLEKEFVLKKLKKIGFSENTRAQELSIEDWKKLAKIIEIAK